MGRLVFRRHTPGAQSLIQPSDLTLLGAFGLPNTHGLADFAQGLTGRYVGGTDPEDLRLYSFSQTAGNLVEFTPPADNLLTTVFGDWTDATVTYDFGDIFQNAIWDDVYDPGGQEGLASGIRPWRCYWDPIGLVMYSTYNLAYDNNYTLSPVAVIRSTLNDGNHTGTGIACWRLAPKTTFGNRWCFEILPIPVDFAATYCDDRRLGVGSGGSLSIISNDFSAGPALFAIDPPDVADDRDYISGGITPLLYYPSHTTGSDGAWGGGPTRAPRPAGLPCFHEFDAFGYDVWNWSDGNGGNTSVWIDGPSKHGLITFAALSGGNTNTTILGSQTPTHSVFTVAAIGDLAVGHYVHFETDITDGQGTYPWCSAAITAIAGAQVTVGTVINGYSSGASVTLAIPTVGGFLKSGNWYQSGGQATSFWQLSIMGHDPADLALVAQESVNAQRTPYFNEGFTLEGFPATFPGGGVGAGSEAGGIPEGSWLDMTVSPWRLYLHVSRIQPYPGYPSDLVYVFEVDC